MLFWSKSRTAPKSDSGRDACALFSRSPRSVAKWIRCSQSTAIVAPREAIFIALLPRSVHQWQTRGLGSCHGKTRESRGRAAQSERRVIATCERRRTGLTSPPRADGVAEDGSPTGVEEPALAWPRDGAGRDAGVVRRQCAVRLVERHARHPPDDAAVRVGARDRGARPDARRHAGWNRPVDRRRLLALRRDRDEVPGGRQPPPLRGDRARVPRRDRGWFLER